VVKDRRESRDRIRYAKELIAAAGWGTSTTSYMSSAMCDALKTACEDHDFPLSVDSLVTSMNDYLAENMNDGAVQAIRCRLKRTENGRRIRFPDLRIVKNKGVWLKNGSTIPLG
jgi:hypothetical protein